MITVEDLLPIAWLVACGSRGHFAEEDHMTLIEQAKDLLPQGASVMFLESGNGDSCGFSFAGVKSIGK